MDKVEIFNKYLEAKVVLNSLVCQIYGCSLKQEKANELGIEYSSNDIFDDLNRVECVFHKYDPQGIYVWNKLGLKKPIILLTKMWDLRRTKEEYNESRDYYSELLELEIINLYLIDSYYKFTITEEDAKRNNIVYDKEYDRYNKNIEGYYHMFESAGENAWALFDFKNHFIPASVFDELRYKLTNELLKLDNGKRIKCVKVKNNQ